MNEEQGLPPELPDILKILSKSISSVPIGQNLYLWENIVFSLLVIAVLSFVAYRATRKPTLVPGRLQNAVEVIVGGLDDFVCGILGPKGRKYVPFIGTLFVYIFTMNMIGLIPFLKSPTASWSTTLALALCVFVYVQYTAVKELGIGGYLDHLAGQPRGAMAYTVIMPVFIFFLHVIAELIRPLSLSLRLRSNVWGDELLLAVLSGFGLGGLPLLVFNMAMAVLMGIVQTVVFCILTTIYFALVLSHEHEPTAAISEK
ncbi:MAG: F0F1 ATP synthase subunit A [Candidatus Omnitrophica bacterium]|nr:F0F1 ATP synthase subunit A [Candidatus Omnitrophota bacterium]